MMPGRHRNKRVNRDWLNTNFPCMMACPVHTHAGRYVALIAEGRFEEAYRIARDSNPLASICGRVCTHPCEDACRRGKIDEPISIRALERFLTERYGPESKHHVAANQRPIHSKLRFKVAVVGGGPSGLSAAHDLALIGYSVTIFEAAPFAGGRLYTATPDYRLPRHVIEAQVRELLAAGNITLKPNHAAGRDFTISDLRRQGFDAVLIAVGAHPLDENSKSPLERDRVIMPASRRPALDFLLPEDGVAIAQGGLIAANPYDLATSASGIFAGGGCVFGPRAVIDSIADGKRATMGIDHYLRGVNHPDPVVEVEVLDAHSLPPELLVAPRQAVRSLPSSRRTGVTEVEISYEPSVAMEEARRCLHCWVNTIFEGDAEDDTQCILCGECVDVCPESCLNLVSLDRISFGPDVLQHVRGHQDLFDRELNDVAAEKLGAISGRRHVKG